MLDGAEYDLARVNPSKGGWEPGLISEGWALITYAGKPILLLGRGDYLAPAAFRYPMGLEKVGQLIVDSDEVAGEGAQATWLRLFTRHIARLSAPSISATADLLLELTEKIDPNGQDALTLELPLTQGKLAEVLGVSAVHMNRTLRHLAHINVARHVNRTFIISSRRRLKELASILV